MVLLFDSAIWERRQESNQSSNNTFSFLTSIGQSFSPGNPTPSEIEERRLMGATEGTTDPLPDRELWGYLLRMVSVSANREASKPAS